jgi:nitroreductase
MDEIFRRRSIRSYLPDPLKPEEIDKLLRAAMCAPTARNTRPWEFLVVTRRAVLDRIAEALPYARMLRGAPCAVVVCALPDKRPGTSDIYFPQDCAAATENILLQAVGLGLGGVWCGVYPRAERMEAIRSILELPSHVVPFNVIVLGHPAEEPAPADKFDPGIIHMERW